MTTAQFALLRTAIDGDAAFAGVPRNSDGAVVVADALNQPAIPDYLVWKTSVSARQLMGDTGFDWTRVDNLSVGKSRIWEYMMMAGAVDPSQPNTRAGFAACFTAAGDAATLAAILGQCRRKATKGEKVLVIATPGGSGTRGSTANPDTLGAADLPLTPNDIMAAWGV